MAGPEAKMMSPTGQPRSKRAGREGFTLIELILVMALLLIVMAVAFPSLQNFFRGRNLDSEARRLMALTRYGQSRAVSEGIPMTLWFDRKDRSYGLRAMESYAQTDDKAVEYQLRENTDIELGRTFARENPLAAGAGAQALRSVSSYSGNLQQIEFTPDGYISERSPSTVTLTEKEYEITIALATNRLMYVIETNSNTRSRQR
jgi:type II secretion system protein H